MADLFGMEISESEDSMLVPRREPLVLAPSKPRGKHYVEPRGYGGIPGTGPEGKFCKDCAHYTHGGTNRRTFPKCGLNRARWTHGRGSDILANAPACSRFEDGGSASG